MYSRISFLLLPVFLIGMVRVAFSQCNPYFPQPLSARPANYTIDVRFDHTGKTIDAVQIIRFVNRSPVPIPALRMYMYLNAFKNTESTFLKGTSTIFGQGFTQRKADEWGWIAVEKIRRINGADLSATMRYIHPDVNNAADQSVLEIPLDEPIQPGDSAVFLLNWKAKMPKTIARAGYRKDFFFFCHWFPQLGVFEKNAAGVWDWNCHQFFRSTEFYANFGVYDVRITADKKFVMGASGCLVQETDNSDGTITRHYHAEDVIDFAWAAYPFFEVQEDRWRDVQIRLLIPPSHANLGPRYLYALKFAFEYLDKHVGHYPYPSLTVVDPPFNALASGLMEYPTLITAGTFYRMPENMHNMESLVVHEFVHQYFMGMVASNEKEEAWLDEGFATYFEDRIIDAAYGKKNSLVDVFGYQFDNRELTRLEYTTMRNPREGTTGRPGWMFSETNGKALIYSKTATALHTVQALIGDAEMDRIIQTYFEQWKFKHPRGSDFLAVLKMGLMAGPDTVFAKQVYDLFYKSIYEAVVLDYAVTQVTNEYLSPPRGIFGENVDNLTFRDGKGRGALLSKVEVQRKGDWVFPVEVLVIFADGSTELMHWSGVDGRHTFEFSGRAEVVSAQVDPGYKIGLDIDLNNNSLTLQPAKAPLWRYGAKATFWIQNLMQMISFLV